ncbi:hypothetical protein P152DRAFT_366659, partial [Eremomyces bilateralis CBS 781.70]
KRSSSRTRNPPSRPTTPLRPTSRSSLRDSTRQATLAASQSAVDGGFPLDALEPRFAELSDAMGDLEANFMHLQIMHESLGRFSEDFAAFLYGMNMNAFCVDYPEAPIPESFKRASQRQPQEEGPMSREPDSDAEATFLTTDTSFVDNPPTSSKASSRFMTPGPRRAGIGRGGPTRGTGRGSAAARGPSTRASGLARATTRGRG